jgi:signal transduction histidine kinase
VVVVDPSRVRTNADPPPVVVERALVDGSPLRERSAARVGPGSRTIEMHYAALSFVQPHRIRYRHRLHGFDDRWIDAGPRRSARYTNLPPGRYAFRVQARSADGVWNENGASFALELAPHFHETPWFWGLCALAALAAAAGGYRLRLRQLRARYATILAERARVARGLHDNLLQALSGVAMQLDAASEGLPPAADDARRRVDRARGLVAQSLEEARRTVWDLRGQAAGAGDLAAALARLADRIADGGAVSCHVRVEGEPRHLAPDLKQELFQIGKEAIANALTHAGASRIDARLRYRAGGVTLAVRDDGRGFDPDRAPGPAEGHFGLVGMRERAARVAARLAIRSRPGEGTEVEVDAATPAPGASRPWPRAT